MWPSLSVNSTLCSFQSVMSLCVHMCKFCRAHSVCMLLSLYLPLGVLLYTPVLIHKLRDCTEKVKCGQGDWSILKVSVGTQISFSPSSLRKNIKWHLSQPADCRGGHRQWCCTILTWKLVHVRITADSRFQWCVCMYCMSPSVCQSCRRNGQESTGSYLCVTGRGTIQRIDAKPTATLLGYSAFYSPHSSKRQKIFLCLPLRLALCSHCVLWSVLLFKCSYSPFRRRVTFKPTVTMATPICIWKSTFEGANKMCNNMLWHCTPFSKYSKYGLIRNGRWVFLGSGECKCWMGYMFSFVVKSNQQWCSISLCVYSLHWLYDVIWKYRSHIKSSTGIYKQHGFGQFTVIVIIHLAIFSGQYQCELANYINWNRICGLCDRNVYCND